MSESYNEEHQEHEGSEGLTQDEIHTLGRSYMIRTITDGPVKVGLTEREATQLDDFLATADPEDLERVKTEAVRLNKYFIYTNPYISEEEKAQIEEEMEQDAGLKEYIEKTQAWALTEAYCVWKLCVRKAAVEPDERIFDMTDEEILTFFTLIEEYPDVVDEALRSSTSQIKAGPQANSKFTIVEHEQGFLSEREELMELKRYFTGQMSSDERDNFHNEIIDDIHFRSMFEKIQSALR